MEVFPPFQPLTPGRTAKNNIYVFLEESHDEVKVLCHDGLVGWVSKSVMRLNNDPR